MPVEHMRLTHFLSRRLRQLYAPRALRMAHSGSKMTDMKFGEVIKTLRNHRSLNQAELAALVGARLGNEGYDQSNISRIEAGNQDVTLSQIEALAAALEVSVADIWGLGDLSANDPELMRWLAAYRRLSEKQRSAVLDLVAS